MRKPKIISKLKVIFDDPSAGWIWIHIHSTMDTVSIDASYIYNSILGLAEALYKLTAVEGQQTVTWQCEPAEYDMRFVRTDATIQLDVLFFPDAQRSVFQQPKVKLSVKGNYDEVCLPFWRALRELQGRFPASEFRERWQEAFPTLQMERLTAALGK